MEVYLVNDVADESNTYSIFSTPKKAIEHALNMIQLHHKLLLGDDRDLTDEEKSLYDETSDKIHTWDGKYGTILYDMNGETRFELVPLVIDEDSFK